MLLEKERHLIVEYGKKLITENLTKGTGGNLSIYNRDKNLIAISPSGLDYYKTKAEDVVVIDINGTIIEGKREPSSEHNMHSIFYRNRGDIDSIVHTHSVFSSVLSTLRIPLPPTNYLVALAGKDVRCADYAAFGTEELAKNAYQAMKGRYAVLLANHGLLTGSSDISSAMNLAIQIEHCAEIHYRALSIGKPIVLNEKEVLEMLRKFGTDKIEG